MAVSQYLSMNETVEKRNYVLIQPSMVINIILIIIVALLMIIGVSSNSVVLYVKWTQRKDKIKRKKKGYRGIFDRFIVSLAMSDLLACTISYPLLLVEFSSNFLELFSGCIGSRLVFASLAFITINNLIVLGLDRWFAVFRPTETFRNSLIRKLLVVSWLLGLMESPTLIFSVFERKKHFIGELDYTWICQYDSEGFLKKAIFIFFSGFVYTLPSIALVYVCCRIYFKFRKTKKALALSSGLETMRKRAENRKNLRASKLFLSVILSFVMTYF